jgi:hypothetical protein
MVIEFSLEPGLKVLCIRFKKPTETELGELSVLGFICLLMVILRRLRR